jgi:ATP-dependent DNA helicase RecG
VVLLTGSTSRKDRDAALKLIESGEGHVVIGTHSLISDDVVFKSLGLAVVDEQHRFGVEQRAALASKGEFLFIPVWSTSMTMCFVYRARGRYGSAG